MEKYNKTTNLVQESLNPSSIKAFAKALALKSSGAANPSDGFTLGLKELGLIKDYFNRNNPLLVYSRGFNITALGSGTITIKYDSNPNPFKKKSNLGNGDIETVSTITEVIEWNEPQYICEGLSDFDIKSGVINTLSYRMEKYLIKFNQALIKAGFDLIHNNFKGTSKTPISLAKLTGKESDAREMFYKIIKEATRLVKKSEVSSTDITITVTPEVFDNLAFAGLVGNRAEQTYAGGQYSIGTIGGYRIQSGEMFISTVGEMPAAGDMAVVIGTNQVIMHNSDILASNVARIGLSNDIGTYLEVIGMNRVPKFVKGVENTDKKNQAIIMEFVDKDVTNLLENEEVLTEPLIENEVKVDKNKK